MQGDSFGRAIQTIGTVITMGFPRSRYWQARVGVMAVLQRARRTLQPPMREHRMPY